MLLIFCFLASDGAVLMRLLPEMMKGANWKIQTLAEGFLPDICGFNYPLERMLRLSAKVLKTSLISNGRTAFL